MEPAGEGSGSKATGLGATALLENAGGLTMYICDRACKTLLGVYCQKGWRISAPRFETRIHGKSQV